MRNKFIILIALIFQIVSVKSQSIFPVSTSVKNLKTDYGAVGDGITDDTKAINDALVSNFTGIIYIPNGIYNVTGAIKKRTQGVGTYFYGQSRDGVIIKLADGVSGFGNALSPRALITCCDAPGGISADVFYFNWCNFTVDVGNNPGAIGIRFYSNNEGNLNNIHIKATNAAIGLDLGYRDQNGPCLISRLEVEGFSTGISTKNVLNSQTLYNINIHDCSVGLLASGQVISVENLVTTNVLAPVQTNSIMTLINSSFTGGNNTEPGIKFLGGQLFARNINAVGFTNVLGGTKTFEGTHITEWIPKETPDFNFTDHRMTSLNLPIKPIPDFILEPDLNKWEGVNSHGAKSNGSNCNAAFQAAIDAAAAGGKTTVYFERCVGGDPNWYLFNGTIHIHGSVRHIFGLGFARVVGGGTLVLDADAAPVVKIENMHGLTTGTTFNIINNNTSTLIVENGDGNHIIASGAGDIFINDVPATIEVTNANAHVWARQLNPESKKTDIDVNNGGTLWVLGLKTEGSGPIKVSSGGNCEIMGAHIYNLCDSPVNPLFEVTDASASFACIREVCYCTGKDYKTHVSETREGTTENWHSYPREWSLFSAVSNGATGNRNESINSKEIFIYPNPTNQLSLVSYVLSENSLVKISICDALGKEVKLVANEKQSPGEHQQNLPTEQLQSGNYFVKMIVNGEQLTKKLIVSKLGTK